MINFGYISGGDYVACGLGDGSVSTSSRLRVDPISCNLVLSSVNILTHLYKFVKYLKR